MTAAADPPPTVSIAEYLARKNAPPPTSTAPAVTPTDGTHPYAAAALRNEVAAVAAEPEGGRNDRLNLAALNLGGLVAGGHLTRGEVEQALTAAALAAGLTPTETRGTIRSGLRAGIAKPRDIPAGIDHDPNVKVVTIDEITGEATETETTFWQSRPYLAHIYQYALARMCSPWAVLGVAIVRTLAHIPPWVTLPPLIGGRGSLNAFIAIVGPSGVGKGAAEAAAQDCIRWPDTPDGPLHTVTLGSGEGIAHQYRHYEKGEIVRDRDAVLFTVSEVDTLTALGTRQGATIMGQLRAMFSGEALGFAYADASRRILLPAHEYRACLSIGVQPARAKALLDDADGGTPQRIVWFPATSPDITDTPPAEPAPLRLKPIAWGNVVTRDPKTFAHNIVIPETVAAEIRGQHAARARGEGTDLDGHATFAREKVAFALAVLDGRHAMTEDDWALSAAVMQVSDQTRRAVQHTLTAAAERADRARSERDAQRQIHVEDKTREAAIQRAAHHVLKHVEAAGGQIGWAELRRSMRSDSRRWMEDGVGSLQDAGRITVDQDGSSRVVKVVTP